MLGPSASYLLADDDEGKNQGDDDDEQDLKDDPLYSLDLLKHLQDFLKHLATIHDPVIFQQISSQWLSSQELLVLRSVLAP